LFRHDAIERYGKEDFISILPNVNKRNLVKFTEHSGDYTNRVKVEFTEEKISIAVSVALVCAIIRNDKINIRKIINEVDKGL